MKYTRKDIENLFFFQKYQSLENIRRLCSLVGFTNIMTCTIFYYGIITSSYSADTTKYLVIAAILTHTYINAILIKWALPYANAKWMKGTWISLISISPAGLMLMFAGSNDKIGSDAKTEKKNTAFYSLTNSSVDLTNILHKAIEYLDTHHHDDFSDLIRGAELNVEEAEQWPEHAKYMIIALHEALKQCKKNKDGFKSIEFGARGYDQRRFSFAVKDPKSQIVPNLRYKYSFGFIVLDEFNNYQKILDSKKEIKANMKFGPAKSICLHWGKGFKIYVNE